MQSDKIHNKTGIILLYFNNFTDNYGYWIAFLNVLPYTLMETKGAFCLDAKTISNA